ncbi:FeoC-like transcriptional regulator [Streptomyces xanthochromogenes]|uniref:FeoC-like transcriptional regulator n=1 Tax=Streptomyces xanthochromogenes TaxID=67384 RepID=UPI0034202AE1
MSTLRQVLAAIESAARTGAGLDSVARSLGLSRAEVDAMAEYWVRKGRLTREEIGGGCPAAGCGGCPVARGACATSGGRPAPLLIALRPRRSGESTGVATDGADGPRGPQPPPADGHATIPTER